ncbi:MAG: glycoside hydrolase family 5 protein, partial [Chloroflexi bacterium]|nr:glycoside hydrolase family 5 protein [Chloroflexota bacterium]
MDLLQVKGNRIVNARGESVRLRGTAVGGWMNMENFINGYPGNESGIRAAAAEILGASKAEFLFERWLDHFLNEDDVRFIKQTGANVVRLALHYRHFESDAAPFTYREQGFARLQQMVDWCAQHELYIILDLHSVQGTQNPDWHSDSKTRYALFWEHPHFQDRFVALWEELARRYVGN